MNLSESREPARTVGNLILSLVSALGVALLAVNAGWPDAPHWFQLVSIGLAAGLPALGVKLGTEKVRNAVYSTPSAKAAVAQAIAVERAGNAD